MASSKRVSFISSQLRKKPRTTLWTLTLHVPFPFPTSSFSSSSWSTCAFHRASQVNLKQCFRDSPRKHGSGKHGEGKYRKSLRNFLYYPGKCRRHANIPHRVARLYGGVHNRWILFQIFVNVFSTFSVSSSSGRTQFSKSLKCLI